MQGIGNMMGAVMAASLAAAGDSFGGGYSPDTHAPTSAESQKADISKAEQKRQRRLARNKAQKDASHGNR